MDPRRRYRDLADRRGPLARRLRRPVRQAGLARAGRRPHRPGGHRLAGRDQAWRDAVQYVAIDMRTIFKSAIRRVLPQATLVVDHFHWRTRPSPRSAAGSP
ncbi:transposase [Streptomyces sp. NBC_01550]|uniref:transposase n=1 Tax=Streptomyces sp. NBC_01550 TaxID=2975875 RepID=UPI003866C3B2